MTFRLLHYLRTSLGVTVLFIVLGTEACGPRARAHADLDGPPAATTEAPSSLSATVTSGTAASQPAMLDDGSPCPIDNVVLPGPSGEPSEAQPSSAEPRGLIETPPKATWSTVANIQGAGVSLLLELPATTFLAGEAVTARLLVRNDGSTPIKIFEPLVLLVDETGQPPVHHDFEPGDWPASQLPSVPDQFDPGQSVTVPQTIQLPFEADASQHTYSLHGVVQYHDPQQPAAADSPSLWPQLDTGPFTPQLITPSPVQHLRVFWQADRQQWCLRATNGLGGPPSVRLTAWMFAHGGGGGSLGPLRGGAGAVWTGSWAPQVVQGNAPIQVQAWVAGPGYVTALSTPTVPAP